MGKPDDRNPTTRHLNQTQVFLVDVLSSSLAFVSYLPRYIPGSTTRTRPLENYHPRSQYGRASQGIRQYHLRMGTRNDRHRRGDSEGTRNEGGKGSLQLDETGAD